MVSYLKASVQVAEDGELSGGARAQAGRGARARAALVHVRHRGAAAEPAGARQYRVGLEGKSQHFYYLFIDVIRKKKL